MNFFSIYRIEKMSAINIEEFYDTVSKRFDVSRVRVWRAVREYIESCVASPSSGEGEATSMFFEIGCGNGKNLLYAKKYSNKVAGIDISQEMVNICLEKGLNVAKGNILTMNENRIAQHVFCIAVIHHFDTEEKRITAIRNVCNCAVSSVLITVWSDSDRRATQNGVFATDQMIPFTFSEKEFALRYIHFFNENELRSLIYKAVGDSFRIEKLFEDCNNWNVILIRN